jgi:TPR repeat protein
LRKAFLGVLLFIVSAGSESFAQGDIALTPEQAAELHSITGSANAVTTPEFQVLKDNSARQAAAVAQSASEVPKKYNAELMRSGVVEQYAQASGNANRMVVASVGEEQVQNIKNMLPKGLEQFGNDINYGKPVATSSEGEKIVALIRDIATHPAAERPRLLRAIQAYSDRGQPEAINFMGFISEYGLFGVTPDLSRATEFYASAARHHYQPAIFNLANIAFYGKNGERRIDDAQHLISQAYALGNERSFRVCGLGAFMAYRRGNDRDALAYGKGCYSSLANIPNAAYANNVSLAERIKMLRDSIGTGVDDGFDVLQKITQPTIGNREYLYCKYWLINHIRFTGQAANLAQLAHACYGKTTPNPDIPDAKASASLVVSGITNFVPFEINSLRQMRQGNHFHYAWSVPYLPFGQNEVDLFEPIMRDKK